MANRYAGLATVLKRGDGASPEVFTAIPQVTQLDGPKMDSNLIDATTLEDTFEQFVQGVNKPGSVTFDLVWDPQNAQHKGLENDYVNKTRRNFTINWPDAGATLNTFTAFVKMFSTKAAPKSVLSISVELQLTGAPGLVTT